MNKTLMLASSLLAFIAIDPSLADTSAPPAKTTRTFDIVRENSKIGTDVVEIEKQGDMTTVNFKTHISVVIVIEVYHYEHMSSETWKGDQFVSFKSQTDDNGKKHVLSATADGDKIQFEIDGKHSEGPKTVLPASFWNKSFLDAHEMFDEANGKRLSVKASDLGEETVTVHGTKRKAHHYKISGDLERDVWFDGDTLIRLKLSGSDGSKIYSDLRP
jgi:Family of unknown function (DUF6134)